MAQLRQPDFRNVPVPVTVTNANPSTSPLIVPVDLGDVFLIAVTVMFPPGPRGQVGVHLDLAGQTIVPWSDTQQWLIADAQTFNFDVGMEVDQGMNIHAYDNGGFNHLIQWVFKVSDIQVSGATLGEIVPINPALLSAS